MCLQDLYECKNNLQLPRTALLIHFRKPDRHGEEVFSKRLVSLAARAQGSAASAIRKLASRRLQDALETFRIPLGSGSAEGGEVINLEEMFGSSGGWIVRSDSVGLFAFLDNTGMAVVETGHGPVVLPVVVEVATRATPRDGSGRFAMTLTDEGQNGGVSLVLSGSRKAKIAVGLMGPDLPSLPRFDETLRRVIRETMLQELVDICRMTESALDASLNGPEKRWPPVLCRRVVASDQARDTAREELRAIGVATLMQDLTYPPLLLTATIGALFQDARDELPEAYAWSQHIALQQGNTPIRTAVHDMVAMAKGTPWLNSMFSIAPPDQMLGEDEIYASVSVSLEVGPSNHEKLDILRRRPGLLQSRGTREELPAEGRAA